LKVLEIERKKTKGIKSWIRKGNGEKGQYSAVAPEATGLKRRRNERKGIKKQKKKNKRKKQKAEGICTPPSLRWEDRRTCREGQ